MNGPKQNTLGKNSGVNGLIHPTTMLINTEKTASIITGNISVIGEKHTEYTSGIIKQSSHTVTIFYQTILTASGCASNNSTKAVPCLTADILGDWREELILRTEDNSKLRVWCTNTESKYRLTTLMHDMQYRMQTGCEQSSYNQPPHPSFYLGTEAQLPERPNVKLL